ncbi:acrosin-like [Sabethes cyaneus]|uniref:acrosin-like n=1 Tax=Sabethes cyaneus TaxID=53552 RepID=UPI00237E3E05|nr:acrosin-like [Sabethes cyaneus]
MALLEILLLATAIGSSSMAYNVSFPNVTIPNPPWLNNTNITLPMPFTTVAANLPPQSEPNVTQSPSQSGIPLYKHPHYDQSGTALWFPRIIGGTPATVGEFPSKVSLQMARTSAHFCGGTLLTMRHVLTAAHCVTNIEGIPWSPATIQAMADDLNVLPRMGSPSRQVRQVQFLVIHNNYHPAKLHNDIAIVRLVSDFTKTATLYPTLRVSRTPPGGELCSLAGWGVTSEHSQIISPTLQRVNLAVVDFERCNLNYQGSLTAGMLCACAPGRDACQGDSGGALICHNRVAGVVSFGAGCAHPDFPGVYMDVAHYEKWISKVISGAVRSGAAEITNWRVCEEYTHSDHQVIRYRIGKGMQKKSCRGQVSEQRWKTVTFSKAVFVKALRFESSSSNLSTEGLHVEEARATNEELIELAKTMKGMKAPGSDGIPNLRRLRK